MNHLSDSTSEGKDEQNTSCPHVAGCPVCDEGQPGGTASMDKCEHPTAFVVGGETWQRCLTCGAQRERPAPPEGHGDWGPWNPQNDAGDSRPEN